LGCGIGPIAAVARYCCHGHVTLAMFPFQKFFSRHVSTFLRACLPNWKFVSLDILELLAFNAQKFMGSLARDRAHFFEIVVRGHVGTIPGNTLAKFEVRTFSRFGADRQTDRPEETYLASGRG